MVEALVVVDVNDGVFSLLNGDSPFHSRPALRNFTRRPDDFRDRKPRAQLVEKLRRKAHGDLLKGSANGEGI